MIRDASEAQDHVAKPAVLAALVAALLPWLFVEHFKGINPDIYWLTLGAGRLLNGATMMRAVYDPNPPLGLVLHVPLYLLWQRVGIQFPDAIIMLTGFYLFLAVIAVFVLGRRLLGDDSALVLAVSFLLASTVMCTSEFGQRDQLIAIALVPFVLSQMIVSRRVACSRALLNVVFAGGGVLILLKPHYLLIPAALIVYRLYLRRRLSVALDPDALILTILSAAYLIMIWLMFRDYAAIIFPDVLKLYLGGKIGKLVIARSLFYFAILGTSLIVSRIIVRGGDAYRAVTQLMFLCSILSLIPYVAQMKGFNYHLIPALTFFWTGVALAILPLARRFLSPSLSVVLLIALYSPGATFIERPLLYPGPGEVKSFPLTRSLAACSECRLDFLNTDIRATMMTSYYAGVEYSSRFPSLWFLQKLVDMSPGSERDRIFHKYAVMLAEDLRKANTVVVCADGIDYVHYFSREPDFIAAWQTFRSAETTFIDYDSYYPGTPAHAPTVPCEIYHSNK
jgi:hypothetical protein